MQKLIELPRRGSSSRWFICPTENLRALIIRHRERLLPGCNYLLPYRDVNGFGIQLAVAAWVQPGRTYTVPN